MSEQKDSEKLTIIHKSLLADGLRMYFEKECMCALVREGMRKLQSSLSAAD